MLRPGVLRRLSSDTSEVERTPTKDGGERLALARTSAEATDAKVELNHAAAREECPTPSKPPTFAPTSLRAPSGGSSSIPPGIPPRLSLPRSPSPSLLSACAQSLAAL